MKNKQIFFAILAVALVLGMTACSDEAGIGLSGKSVSVTGVSLNKTSLSLDLGETETLTAIITPPNAINRNVKWSSENTDIATVEGGVVTGVSVGTTIITVTAVDTANGVKTDTCTVTVNGAPIPVENVSLNKTSTGLIVGGTGSLVVHFEPDNATNKKVTWESSAEGVATVSEGGVVTGVSVGSATITVTTDDGGYQAYCTVSVSNVAVPVTGISLSQDKLDLFAGGAPKVLYPHIEPTNATNQNITWSSSNDRVATVTLGQVAGVSGGTATIIVTTEEGGKIAMCEVTVTVPVTGVTLNNSSINLNAGGTETLVARIEPPTATNQNIASNQKVTWESSAPNVATVSNGVVTAGNSGGTAKITVTTDDGKYTASCDVNVAVPVSGVFLNKPETVIFMGKSETLFPTIIPLNATNPNVSWNSSKEDVATVSQEGVVTGVKAGSAIIIVTAVDTTNGVKTALCTVTVSEVNVPVTGVTLNKSSIGTSSTFYVGDIETLSATIAPQGATNQNLIWNSSNDTVAKVLGGTVTAVGVGAGNKTATATITVTTADGLFTDTCTVTVSTASVTGVSLFETSLILNVGATASLTATIAPANASNRNVTWDSSNKNVATVSSSGVVSAVAKGSTTITVTTDDGGKTASCVVTVTVPVSGVTLDKISIKLVVGGTETLTETVAPLDASNKAVKWSSKNDPVATVTANGVVTGVKGGNATITVTTDDGNKTAECTVTVIVPVTDVNLNKTTTNISVGGTETLVATIEPPTATNQNVTWSSDSPSIATVTSPGGVVTGLNTGTATITVTAVDTTNGVIKRICTVIISDAYTVFFDSNGGSTVTNQLVISGGLASPPSAPTKPDYTFNGWYSDSGLITAYNFNTPVTNNIFLYAKWIPKVEMVTITGGQFTMGSPNTEPDRLSNEDLHVVTLSSFRMGKYEVTQEQYKAVMGTNPSGFTTAVTGETDKLPVEEVSWYDAILFCNKLSMAEGLSPAYSISGKTDPAEWGSAGPAWDAVEIVFGSNGYRLPTEAQWEFACRAGTTTAYSTGATVSNDTGWYANNSAVNGSRRTHQVGLKPTSGNAWGLYDMHGNVYEWCWNWYADDNTTETPNDPMGPTSGTKRLRRGGCYDQSAENMRSAYRSSNDIPSNKSNKLGFRVVAP